MVIKSNLPGKLIDYTEPKSGGISGIGVLIDYTGPAPKGIPGPGVLCIPSSLRSPMIFVPKLVSSSLMIIHPIPKALILFVNEFIPIKNPVLPSLPSLRDGKVGWNLSS